MKSSVVLALAILLSPAWVQSQTPPTPPAPATAAIPATRGVPATTGVHMKFVYRTEMGKWWKRDEVVKKLQLSDGQISQLDEIFNQHRLNLKAHSAEMEKQDVKLQTLLDADVPNEGQIGVQVDQVLAARGKLEREFTMMNLDLRKVLSLEQWRSLKSMRGEHGAFGDRVFFQKFVPGPGVGPGGPHVMPLPPGALPLLEPPLGVPPDDEMF